MILKSTHLRVCLLAAVLALTACTDQSDEDFTASAQSLLDQKDIKGAIIQLKNALLKNPESGPARQLLGRALLESNDPKSAVLELRKALELKQSDELVVPHLARAMLVLGEGKELLAEFGSTRLKDPAASADLQTTLAAAYASQGDLDKANLTVAAALQADPGHAPAVIMQAQLKLAARDLDGALRLLDTVLGADPNNERAGVLKGDVLLNGKKDGPAALDIYRKVLAAHPRSVAAHTAIIGILFDLNQLPEALAQVELLKQAAPDHPETLFVSARMALSQKDYKATREITGRMLKYYPENAQVLQLAGAAEFRLREYSQAETLLSHALKNAPDLLLTRQMLAQTYLNTNRPDKALETLRPVIEGKAPNGVSLALAGEAWLEMGEAKKSEAAFALAAKVAPADNRVRTSAAMAQASRGNSAAAIAELETIASEDKGPRADVALISARLRKNDLEGAMKAIDGLERKIPDRPVAYNLRGRVLLLKRDIPGATKAFETALSKDPNYFPAVASMAAIDLNAGKPDAARKRFEDLVQADPKNYQALLALAELGVRTGAAPEDVLKLLRSAVKANAGAPTPHLVLISQLLTSDPKAALTAAQDATAALPNNLDIMEALGRTQVAANNAEAAVSTYTKLAALQPTNAVHQVRLAEALLANKDSDGARRALRRALAIKPDLVLAKRALVSLAVMEGKPQDALTLTREMQKLDPKDPMAFALEGDVEASRKNWDAAAAAYRTALSKNKSTDVVVRLHTALRAGGKAAEADRLAADWMKEKPKDPAFRFYLGDAALARNDFAAAEGHYRAVVEMQPRNALALNNMAWLMVKQGKPGAVALAQQANDILPGRPPLIDTLALALAADNQLPKAIELQKVAIARNPTDPTLKLTLAKLLIKSGDKTYARAELEDLAKLGAKFRDQAEVASLLKSL